MWGMVTWTNSRAPRKAKKTYLDITTIFDIAGNARGVKARELRPAQTQRVVGWGGKKEQRRDEASGRSSRGTENADSRRSRLWSTGNKHSPQTHFMAITRNHQATLKRSQAISN